MGHQSYVLLCTETTLSNPPVVQPKSSCDVHLLRSPCISFHAAVVFVPGKDLSFKSVLGRCAAAGSFALSSNFYKLTYHGKSAGIYNFTDGKFHVLHSTAAKLVFNRKI